MASDNAAAGDRIEIILQDEITNTDDLFAAQIDEINVRVFPGSSVETTLYAAYVCDLPEKNPGIQGWRMVGAVEGDITLIDATARDIVEDLRDGPVARSGNFVRTEIVDPNRIDPRTGEPQGQGFVSSVVLGSPVGLPPTLRPNGTSTVVELTVGAQAADGEGEEVTGRFVWRDGLLISQGDDAPALPVDHVVSIEGKERGLTACQELPIRFTSFSSFSFIRCDSNEDGLVDIADAVTIFDRIFRDGESRACLAASDCDADGGIGIADAIYVIEFNLRGGPPPSDPFPLCGDPVHELDECPGSAAFCQL
jgi:hypothetical protein